MLTRSPGVSAASATMSLSPGNADHEAELQARDKRITALMGELVDLHRHKSDNAQRELDLHRQVVPSCRRAAPALHRLAD